MKELPEELVPAAAHAREALVEAAAEFDEALAARFLDDEPIGADPLRKAIREATLRMQLVPVLCGAAFKNKGVQPLLDAVVDFLPSPLDVPPVEGHAPAHGRAGAAQGRRQRAVRRARLQADDRQARRPPDLHPRLLRVA